jgi:hypothetical protein
MPVPYSVPYSVPDSSPASVTIASSAVTVTLFILLRNSRGLKAALLKPIYYVGTVLYKQALARVINSQCTASEEEEP